MRLNWTFSVLMQLILLSRWACFEWCDMVTRASLVLQEDENVCRRRWAVVNNWKVYNLVCDKNRWGTFHADSWIDFGARSWRWHKSFHNQYCYYYFCSPLLLMELSSLPLLKPILTLHLFVCLLVWFQLTTHCVLLHPDGCTSNIYLRN